MWYFGFNMKKPSKPHKPRKPEEPSKFVTIKRRRLTENDLGYIGSSFSLKTIKEYLDKYLEREFDEFSYDLINCYIEVEVEYNEQQGDSTDVVVEGVFKKTITEDQWLAKLKKHEESVSKYEEFKLRYNTKLKQYKKDFKSWCDYELKKLEAIED